MKLNKLFLTCALMISCLICLAQEQSGRVTYVTSSSVYVRFESTEQMQIGDTLFVNQDGQMHAVLLINKKSSISTVCHRIGDYKPIKGGQIIFISQRSNQQPDSEEEVISKHKPDRKGKTRGSVSAATYISGSDAEDMSLRNMYRLSLNAIRIADSKFSMNTYLTYRQNNIANDEAVFSNNNLFNVYGLSVSYEPDSVTTLTFGRSINRNATSLGQIDGLQAERYFGNLYVGAIAGFRPDFADNSFNSDLFQLGGYVGFRTSGKKLLTKTNLGVMEQKNMGNTDRRYLYFQHSSNVGARFRWFAAMEMDLYELTEHGSGNEARLTNLYLSGQYKINEKVNVSLSYDNRRRILYYETFRTIIEDLLANDQARQGVRARVNFRPKKYVNASLSYGKRFQSDLQNQSDNINGYLGLTRLPIGGRISFNANYNRSTYLSSQILSIRHSRDIIPRKLSMGAYYRFVHYSYVERPTQFSQQYFGSNLTVYLAKKLVFNVLGEFATRPEENNWRINARLIKRF